MKFPSRALFTGVVVLASALLVFPILAMGQSRPCCGPDACHPMLPGGPEFGWPTIDDLPDREAAANTEPDEADEKTSDSWDVQAPPYAYRDIDIDVDEGTWMNLDVSPDGREIAFDLLGDIYRLPITGGDAIALTNGIAWDMQPRYSPDGQRIAFTSDRGGGDNVWIMSREGDEFRQVTKESFRLLNSPTWTPDGEYIAARKHFTSRRSLGAGEIWLYHASGGTGLQMTEKPNKQKDVGEPAFSSDGKYLFYSRDATPGGTFEYSKDPNDEIYAVFRVDRETGRTDKYIRGPGGAVRPTPSPDGKYIAFVRRVHYQSNLFLKDIASGREWSIYDGLTRDMQETWAIHGVYPSMAWTPDSKSIVFYAKGKLRRINIESGKVSVIPFRVRDTRQVADALRYPVDVAPDEVTARVLRWAQVTPDGAQVVYQAFGKLWIRPLPNGMPRRLCDDANEFEIYPSLTPDGKNVVYTTWNDRTLGAIKIVSINGGSGRVLTDLPGHYIETAVSSDGKMIVFRKTGGGYLRSPLYVGETGLFRMPINGGPATLITRSGSHPHFIRDSQRVFFQRNTRDGDDDKRQLLSIDLDGSDERIEATSKNAIRYRVAPDGKRLAFTERFNVRLAEFPRTGKPLSVDPKMKSVPLATVSLDAGEFANFSADGATLHWTLGGELYSVPVNDALASVTDPSSDDWQAPQSGLNIAPKIKAANPSGTTIFTGARIITMRGDEVIENGTLVVRDNRLVAVGAASDVDVPTDAKQIDLTGLTIMPGLVDVHDHGPYATQGIHPQANWSQYAKLAFGVTTIHDPSHDTNSILGAAELQRIGAIDAPRIFSTGTILYGAKAAFKAEIDSLDDARSHLRRMKAVGAVSVKSYNQPRRDQRQQVIAAARELEMMVVPEGGSLLQHNLTMVVDGHTGVEHSIPVANAYEDILQLWSATKVGYTPTLTVAYGGMYGEHYWYQESNVWENERLLAFVPRFVIDPRARRRRMVPTEELNHINNAKVCKKMLDRGVRVNLGAHGQLAGLAHHWELWMFAQGDMTPLEVIRCGTLHPAWYVGLDRDIGSLEPGKLADFVVLEDNPLDDIRHTANVEWVVQNGRVFDAATMNQVHPIAKQRPAFFWENN